jgi:hypothetical protein
LKPADLVGKWINTEGKDARIWDFQNDSIVTFDNGKFLYKLDSVNNEEILLMNHSKNDSAAVWKIKKMDDGRINLIISKVLANDHNSNKLVLMKTSGLDIILKKTN